MTSWINEQRAFHNPNSVTVGERVIEYLEKRPKKPRTEFKNRNYNTILRSNNQGQLTGGAYGVPNNEISDIRATIHQTINYFLLKQ